VKRFLESQPDFPKDLPGGEIRNQRITDLLTLPIYAGYIEAPSWGVSLRKGHHEPLISWTPAKTRRFWQSDRDRDEHVRAYR
jgi:site-specific DNA recombinase